MKRLILKLIFCSVFVAAGVGNEVWADPVVKGTAVVPKKKPLKKKVHLLSGNVYMVATKSNIPLSYTRKYAKSGKYTFTTTYNVYNSSKQGIRNIVAVHNQKARTVEVTIKDLERAGFPVVNIERTSYETPYMGRFGSYGKVGAIGQGKSRSSVAPGQMTLKFVSRKYDYVNIVHIAGAHEDSGQELQVYILDERS